MSEAKTGSTPVSRTRQARSVSSPRSLNSSASNPPTRSNRSRGYMMLQVSNHGPSFSTEILGAPAGIARKATRSDSDGLRAYAALARGSQSDRGHREVLDREARRVEQRHCIRAWPTGRLARQHRPEVRDLVACHQPRLD